jgi:hypothetical protein
MIPRSTTGAMSALSCIISVSARSLVIQHLVPRRQLHHWHWQPLLLVLRGGVCRTNTCGSSVSPLAVCYWHRQQQQSVVGSCYLSTKARTTGSISTWHDNTTKTTTAPTGGSQLIVSILGPPNAGKSTLFNRLLDKAANRAYKLGSEKGRGRRRTKYSGVSIV